jgi:hypothetical protein
MPTPPRRRRRPRPVLLLLLLLALALPLVAFAAPTLRPFAGNSSLVRIADPALDESSGLAASPTQPGVFWTVEDSDGGPFLHALGTDGAALGRWLVAGAENRDWEDLAAGFAPDGTPVLWIADTGDNAGTRTDAALYRVPEPPVDPAAPAAGWPTLPAERFPLAFPDGPRDVETLLVHPTTGEVVLVSKGWGAAEVFRVRPLAGEVALAEPVGRIDPPGWAFFGQATGGAVSPDGSRLALRTYGGLAEWEIAPGQGVAEALLGEPRAVPAPFIGQGEAVAYGPDGRTLVLSAEGDPAPLVVVPPPPNT